MELQEQMQYDFNCHFEFSQSERKKLECSLFLFENKIYIVSFMDGNKFTKHVFTKDGVLIEFENYYHKLINFTGAEINQLTACYKAHLSNTSFTINNLNPNLIDIFELITKSYFLDRNQLRYSFIEYELKNKDKNNDFLYKIVRFYTKYSEQFNQSNSKNYLQLNLFKNKNEYWYCIDNNVGLPICKFVFELEDLPTQYIFHLIKRENYVKEAEAIDFEILKNDFKNLTNTSYEMHSDTPNDQISFFAACVFSYLPILFEDTEKLSLF